MLSSFSQLHFNVLSYHVVVCFLFSVKFNPVFNVLIVLFDVSSFLNGLP